jgi:hypothetical protein
MLSSDILLQIAIAAAIKARELCPELPDDTTVIIDVKTNNAWISIGQSSCAV